MVICQPDTPAPTLPAVEPEASTVSPCLRMQAYQPGNLFQMRGKPFVISIKESDDRRFSGSNTVISRLSEAAVFLLQESEPMILKRTDDRVSAIC